MKVYILAKGHNPWQNGLLISAEAIRQGKDVKLGLIGWTFNRILSDIKKYRPDWIFLTGARTFTPTQFRYLAQVAKLVVWDVDAISSYTQRYWDALKGIPDMIICNAIGKAEELKDYANQSICIPQYWDTTYQYVSKIPEVKKDVIFIGNSHLSKKRHRWLSRLNKDVNLTVYGAVPGIGSKGIYGREMANAYASHKISFDIQREYVKSTSGGTSDRIFKAIGCGSLYITYPIEDVEVIFTPDKHFVEYDGTYINLLSKIKYYLKHDEEREKIIAEGKSHALKMHTLKTRIDQYWNAMKNYNAENV